jgi:2-oxo-4-hydroxy-4-carboxy-5-ureidoimidazoline decarboxylase
VVQVKLINEMSEQEALGELRRCCGSERWVQAMVARRPFADARNLLHCADQVWWQLSPADWREAFSHHPKIGDVENLRKKFATTATWSEGEQAGVSGAADKTLHELAAGNEAYEKKFGYIFIVCATGKTADEMLELLKKRLPNSPDDEIKNAAAEQAKITHIRLEKLCQEVQSQPTS